VIDRLFQLVQAGETQGILGIGVLAVIFALGSLTYMPRFSLYAIGGVVFGFAAIPAAVIGSTIGATIAYLLARTSLRGVFERRLASRPRWRAALSAIDAEGWRLVALTRLASPLPGGAINYLYGLTGIGFWPYVAGTAIGLLPPVALFAGAGAAGRHVLQDIGEPWRQVIAFAAGATVIAIGVTLIIRRMRTAVKAKGRD
jgi:uncharacterized membrane protein YdjX (TVP38/TMEM64 family)